MTYEMYRNVFLGGLIACGVFFVVSVILFIALHIPKVICDLTGKTAKKAIERIRMQNEQSGDKSYQSSAVNLDRGRLTDKISRSGRLIPRGAASIGTGGITEKIATQRLATEAAGETTLLTGQDETTVLSQESGETDILLTEDQPMQGFTIEYEITYIHTDEIIS